MRASVWWGRGRSQQANAVGEVGTLQGPGMHLQTEKLRSHSEGSEPVQQ